VQISEIEPTEAEFALGTIPIKIYGVNKQLSWIQPQASS